MFLHEYSAPFRAGRRPFGVLLAFFLFFGAGASAFGAPSVEEMAGQMLLVGFKGQEPESCGAILEDIRVRHLGGGDLFSPRTHWPALIGRNIRDAAQVKRLTSALREAAPADRPLFIAVDQEGGKVARFLPERRFSAFTVRRRAGQGTPEARRTRPSARNAAARSGEPQFCAGAGRRRLPRLAGHRTFGAQFSADQSRFQFTRAAFADNLGCGRRRGLQTFPRPRERARGFAQGRHGHHQNMEPEGA